MIKVIICSLEELFDLNFFLLDFICASKNVVEHKTKPVATFDELLLGNWNAVSQVALWNFLILCDTFV